MSGNILVQMLDNRTESFIQQVKEASTVFVAEKVKDALFLDSERYGVDQDNRRVKIYMNNSQILEKVFKLATGQTLTQYIQSLPLGVRQAAGALRARLERMVANTLVEKLSELSVGRTVERVLLQGYGIAKDAIAERIDARYQDKGADINPHLEAILSDVNLKSLTAANVNAEVSSTTAKENKATAEIAIDAKNVAEETAFQTMGLQDVFGRCEYQLKSYLNTLAQDATGYAIRKGLRKVSEASMESTFNLGVGGLVAAASVSSMGLASPAVGVTSLAASQLANQFKDSAVQTAGDRAENFAESLLQQSDLYQREFIALDHSKSGQYQVVEEIDADSELNDGEGWEVVDHKPFSFSEWAKDKLHQLRECFTYEANRRTSGVQEVTRHWFRDNDFDKLSKIREAYVACEKRLIALELELMEATEYARGQRDRITENGLKMWQDRLPEINAEAAKARSEMQSLVSGITGIENAQRKQAIVKEGNGVLAKLNQNLADLQKQLPELLSNAAGAKHRCQV